MLLKSLHLGALSASAAIALLGIGGSALADHDPPSRVARLGYTTGDVSFSPAGEQEWEDARMNRPLNAGDRLWSDEGGRAEVQVGGAMIRMDSDTGISVLDLDDEIAQLELTQGRLNVRVHHLERGQVLEIDTPNLAFAIREPIELRIEVDPDGSATTIAVRDGSGEAYGEGESYVIDSQDAYRFYGSGLRDYELVDEPRFDRFDRWSSDRDRRYGSSRSARYVSRDVLGYQDLDEYGSWRRDSAYGYVWTPRRVSAGWAPYRDGHWAWIDPWGWTWVDDAPWGFAVSHYGRWAHLRGTWCWVPGPARTRAYYAPALVMFVGGSNFQLSISNRNVYGVAWFPLGPREIYRPSYRVSRGYFENINRSNTVINNTVINNYYGRTDVTNVTYVNRRVPGGLVAMPRSAFVERQRVSAAAAPAPREALAGAPVNFAPYATPTERSVRGAATRRERPPPRAFERPVVARNAPPPPQAGFEVQRKKLRAQPGRPLDEAARRELERAPAAAPAPAVKVVGPARTAPPTRRPPRVERTGRADGGRSASDKRETPEAGAGAAPPVSAAPPEAVAPPQRGKEKQHGEQRAQPPSPSSAERRATPPNERTQPEPTASAAPSEAQPVPNAGRSQAERAAQATAAQSEAQPAPNAGRSQAERAAEAQRRELEKAERAKKKADPSLEDEELSQSQGSSE